MTPSDLIVSILKFALNSVLASLTLDPTRDIEDLKMEREAAAAMLTTLNPRDAIQASFAARAVTAHHASMECFRRAALPDVPNAVMTRLIASGMALSRMSVQLIKALEQRKAAVRPGASVADPVAAILAANPAAAPAPTEEATARGAAGAQHPLPSEKRSAGGAPPAAGMAGARPVQPGLTPAGQPGLTPAGQPGLTPAGQPGLTPAGQPGLTPEDIAAVAALAGLRTSVA